MKASGGETIGSAGARGIAEVDTANAEAATVVVGLTGAPVVAATTDDVDGEVTDAGLDIMLAKYELLLPVTTTFLEAAAFGDQLDMAYDFFFFPETTALLVTTEARLLFLTLV